MVPVYHPQLPTSTEDSSIPAPVEINDSRRQPALASRGQGAFTAWWKEASQGLGKEWEAGCYGGGGI